MKARLALRELATVTESQWGMVTAAQATPRGISHLNLSRLADSGDLVRLAHGVYKDAGAPTDEHQALRVAWLAVEPHRFAWERTKEQPGSATVSGESAAVLHGFGNLRAMRSEFTTPVRKQTQRPDVRYRTRVLTPDDVTVRHGLPVTTPERTITDLVEDRAQLDHVADVLRDAMLRSRIDADRLTELLGSLAERNGHRKGDGEALFDQLLQIAGIDAASLSRQIVGVPGLGARVTRDYLRSINLAEILDTPAFHSGAAGQRDQPAVMTPFIGQLVVGNASVMDGAAKLLGGPGTRSQALDEP